LSLILDALRRADSERDRERGAVPGLHAQQLPAFTPAARRRTGAPRWLWLAIVAGTGLSAALAAWVIVGSDPQPAASVPAARPSAAPASTATAAAAAPPVAAAPSRADAAGSQPVAEPAPWPTQAAARKTAEVPSPARAAEARAESPAAAAPLNAPITPREQLPADLRSQLPPLVVGGSIYSASAPDRSIIIDGRILRENDRLAADLTLEQIGPRSAVLRFRGHRFAIAF
jgi:general secretion pathway protein B